MISLEIPHDCTAGAKGLVLELEEEN